MYLRNKTFDMWKSYDVMLCYNEDKIGIGTLDQKMTSFRQSENIIAL